jgi:tripartite-type tricarboxylate transporter receptor subunit TctC
MTACLKPLAAVTLVAALSGPALAQDAGADYFAGKRITIHVGFAGGGAAGTEAGIVARHLGKYIPGQPTVIVDYMPGAGGRVAANSLYNVSAPNGLEIGRIDSTVVHDNLLQEPSVKFQSDKFNWLGSYVADKWLFFARSDAGFKTIDELKASGKKAKIAANGVGNVNFVRARLLMETLGVNFDIITGYAGGPEIDLAISRGEVDGTVGGYTSFFQRSLPAYKEGKLVVLLQSGRGPNHEPLTGLEGVPTIWKLVPPQAQALLRVSGLPWAIPYTLPPNVPPAVVATLRDAFEKLSHDPEFAAEHKKAVGDDVDFTSGKQMQDDVTAMIQSSPETVARLKSLFVEK